MLIKKITHKTRYSITSLLRYMINGMQHEQDMMIAHNLPSFDLYDMTEAFLENDRYRTDPRATVTWYHEILSFSPNDSEYLDNDVLEQITQEYIRQRNPGSLCFAVSHMGDAHKHVHMVFGAVEYRQEKSLRMSDKVFKELRLGMERYQMEHFPELSNSIVYLGREQQKEHSRAVERDRNKRKEREVQAKKRLKGKQTEKEALKKTLQRCYNQSRSPAEFIRHITSAGLELYRRNGKPAGIIGKRKYRFRILGISNQMLMALDRFAERQRDAERLPSRSDGWEREK